TQQEIADKLGVSRPSVSRLLQKARQSGVVEIKISYEGSFAKLEDALEKKFNLREAIITPTEESEALKHLLAEAAANYLVRTIKDEDIVGVSWGTTLVHIPEYIKNVSKNATFVPLVGGVGQTKLDIHSNAITINLARAFGGKGQLLHAPVVVDSVKVKQTLISDTNISQILELASKSNIAIIGIGSPSAQNSTIRQTGYYTDKELNALNNAKAVSDISWIFLDSEGNVCPIELNQRVIGISIDKLKAIPNVVGVAGGVEKQQAILAALRGGYINVLVTDEKTAEFLLSQQQNISCG
ncbi:MAG: sugar-binding transcriptional regulator, partial [Thermoanaerobacteraceae bacterium]|nr:sugar-binding transcriptional regulator [Thermoanaerobacteraceae bacterium]